MAVGGGQLHVWQQVRSILERLDAHRAGVSVPQSTLYRCCHVLGQPSSMTVARQAATLCPVQSSNTRHAPCQHHHVGAVRAGLLNVWQQISRMCYDWTMQAAVVCSVLL
jgi:ABC-type histidine transport system ATPase subunit